MSLYCARGGAETDLSLQQLRELLVESLAAVYLSSDAASFVTGQTLVVRWRFLSSEVNQ